MEYTIVTLILRVKVKPNSRRPGIVEEADGGLTVNLKSPPVEGRANEELIQALAEKYGVPKSRIRIKSGAGSRNKLVEIRS
jgi:uncharacterized protein (TIGR00251 family)